MTARAHTAGRRVAPRRRRVASRRAPSRVDWDRLGRVVLVFVLFAVVASYVSPALHLLQSWRDASAGKQRLAQLSRENAKLQARTAALHNPAVLVREARKQGMVLPGERSFVIHNLPK